MLLRCVRMRVCVCEFFLLFNVFILSMVDGDKIINNINSPTAVMTYIHENAYLYV